MNLNQRKWVIAAGMVAVIAAGMVAVIAASPFALADSDSDRNDLIRNIDDKVSNIADKLSGFDSRRDYDYAEDALSYARDVRDLVSKLDSVKGDDSRANNIVSRYPGYIDSFRDATRYLKKMKELQFLADGVADRCTNDESNLQTLIRNYVARPDDADEAFDKLPAKGHEYAGVYSPLLDKLRDADRDFTSSASSARFSVSDDKWSSVSSNFTSAADRMADYWRGRYNPIDSACKRLAMGDKHPDIEHALSDLRNYTGSSKQTVTQLKKDYNAWLADARKLREMTTQDHEALREVMCRTGGEYDMKQMVSDLADRWANQINSVYATMLGQSDRLAERAVSDRLKKYKGSKEVLDGIHANRATLEKIKNSDLQGTNNPKIKAKLEYGVKKHEELQRSICGSTYPEFEMSSTDCSNQIRPGSGCRADCVVPGSTCMIVEIKPDSDRAKDEGEKQRDSYQKGLAAWYARDKEELFRKYPEIRQCEHDGKLSIDTRPEIYQFCPSSSEAKDMGENLDGISSDVSESE
jgi:hypothetical protein